MKVSRARTTSRLRAGLITPYRQMVLDYACREHDTPTRDQIYFNKGSILARVFTKTIEGNVDLARALRQDVQEAIETFGPEVLSPTVLAKVRAISAHGRRGTSQAASAAEPIQGNATFSTKTDEM